MQIGFEQFALATRLADELVVLDEVGIRNKLITASEDVPDGMKRQFWSHIGTLLLNIMLNRRNEFAPSAFDRADFARKTLCEMRKNLDGNLVV